MKHLLLIFITLLSAAQIISAQPSFSDETVKYKVMYKWGLINKQAGHATLTIRETNSHYITKLVASSEPWADKFYTVRDTLNGKILKDGFKPLFYEKIAHEGSDDKHDIVKFSYKNGKVFGDCTRKKISKGKEKVNQNISLESTIKTVDMLSSYYYMRSLPFEKWATGTAHTICIFSGKRKESLTLKYHGISNIKLDGKNYNCYHITFIFTGDGGKKTSDDMDAWITTDDRRLPVQLEGKLAVGKVRCLIDL